MGICYHYCNVDAFLNIIRNKTLWLSDINRSNDPHEGGKAFDIVFDYYSSHCWHDVYEKERFTWLVNLIQEYFCEMRLYHSFHVYALCFSKEGDLLSQWRGYTKNTAGMSIGFDEDLLDKWSLSYDNKRIAMFKEIHYGEKEQDVKEVIDKLMELSADIDSIGDPSNAKNLLHPFYQYIEEESIDAFFLKDKAFFEEREKRLIYWEFFHSKDAHNIEFWPFSTNDAINDRISEFSLSSVKYHCWQEGFKRYYELSFERVKDSFIREIVIGPRCATSVSDVEELLVREGYKVSGDNRIRVRRSSIHIR